MLSYKLALSFRSSLSFKKPIQGYRCVTSQSNNRATDDLVAVEHNAGSRTAILNSPSSLNAISIPMVAQLQQLYKNWEDSPNIGFVVLKGRGSAFSSGGDVVSLYNMMKGGNVEECKKLFVMAYNFIYSISTYTKPHVAILNGITMGGGAGISVPGTFRLATDKTIFATPETLIGLHPDGGASFYLSRLPGYLGEYLALTGETLNGAEMASCGLATHYSLSMRLPMVENRLRNLVTSDHSVIETCLQSLGGPVHLDHTSVLHRIATVDSCFRHDTVEEIIESLENEAARKNDVWCASTVKKLKKAAPLSLKVALRSIREGRFQTLEQCLKREYRMTVQAISGQITSDFFEGVQAKLVNRDSAPKWDPPSLEHVTEDMVDQYFAPLSEFEPELELPIKHQEACTQTNSL